MLYSTEIGSYFKCIAGEIALENIELKDNPVYQQIALKNIKLENNPVYGRGMLTSCVYLI